MPELTIGGTVIEGVRKAEVRIIHTSRAPEQVPVMEWEIMLRLQNEDMLPKWAMAKQGPDRFKLCKLVVKHSNDQAAHTWIIKNAYVHEFREVEFPEAGGPNGALDENYCDRLIIRGLMLEAKDYTGDNVMTCDKGEERGLPG